LEFTEVSVNWTNKTASEASGRFSITARTTEAFYRSVNHNDALRILGITELFEGERNAANSRISNLPEPHRTNLRNAVPQGQTNRFRFFDVSVPQGGEITITGSIDLAKYGEDWRADRVRANPLPVGGSNSTPVSGLHDASRLDDPQTKVAVEAIIQERKDFVARVDETIAELEQQRLAALQKQREDFERFCSPGRRYEGSFSRGSISGAVRVTFDEWATADRNTVKETITYFNSAHLQFGFTVALNTREVTTFPVIGEVVLPQRDADIRTALTESGLQTSNAHVAAVQDHRIAIRFTDEIVFTVSRWHVGSYENTRVTFNLHEVR
jgi:hypothetical protein